MYHRPLSDLEELQINNKIHYIDDIDLSIRTGVVIHIEHIKENLVFVYVASLKKDENDKHEGSLQYRDIFILDDKDNEEDGIIKDLSRYYSQKYLGTD